MSQQMGARGFGASGVAGANLGNIAAAGEAAKTQLMVDDRVAGIEANLNKLAQVSNLFGHMLSEEQRMEIAQMQEDLEREKFEYTKTEGKEADQWNMLNSSLALLGGENYTGKAAGEALGLLEAGFSPQQVLSAMVVYDGEMTFDPMLLQQMKSPPSDDPDVRQSQYDEAEASEWFMPPPGYNNGQGWPQGITDFERQDAWAEYLQTGSATVVAPKAQPTAE